MDEETAETPTREGLMDPEQPDPTVTDATARIVPVEDIAASADEAPWSPLPTAVVRQYLKTNPKAALGITFPTVFEEDRSKKLQDLGFAQGLDYISHRRAAEQAAQELGQEDYAYDTEMTEIQKEQGESFLTSPLGAADSLAMKMVGLTPPGQGTNGAGRGGGGSLTPAVTPADNLQRRDQVSGDSTAEFRRSQRQAEAVTEAVTGALEGVKDALKDVATRPVEVHVTIPEREITVEGAKAPAATDRVIEYDAAGRPVKIRNVTPSA